MELQTNPAPPRRSRRKRGLQLNKLTTALIAAVLLIGIGLGIFALCREPNDSLWDPVSQRQITRVLEANQDLPEDTELFIDSAVSLVGKVSYFWGGKSKAAGWDPKWGEMTEVTSEGSSTTGTERPFGLDCSGYVTWCTIQLGYDWEQAISIMGNGTVNQWKKSTEIPWEELRPGDLAFQHEPGDPEGNHVGICIGFDRKGEPLFAHCAAGENNVVVTHADGVFVYARRPALFQ